MTTIDASAQRAAYEGLDGLRGAVAALDPATGRILALVTSPSYDPEVLSGTGSSVTDAWTRLNRAPGQPLLNRAIRETYPPGSTFKIVTAAAALDARVVTDPDADTDTPSPYVLPGTSTVLPDEARGCRKASLAEAIRVSCNTVMAHLGVEVGLEGMLEAVGRFGFNDNDLKIPSRVARSNFDSDMTDDQLALSSIGQFDTAATPLQMAMVASAVANGGELMRPRLVDRVTTDDGDTVRQPGNESYHRAMNPATAQQLQRMMVDVVENGTGTNGAIDGVTVGGKTGTAQHGVGNSGIPYAWFISWAQALDSGRLHGRRRCGRGGRVGGPGRCQRRRRRRAYRPGGDGGGPGGLRLDSMTSALEAALARIDLLDPQLCAFSEVWHEEARARAESAARLPLAGLPFAVKGRTGIRSYAARRLIAAAWGSGGCHVRPRPRHGVADMGTGGPWPYGQSLACRPDSGRFVGGSHSGGRGRHGGSGDGR